MNSPKRYAEGTSVSVEKTRSEIETLLKRHKANGFFSATDEERGIALVGFRLVGRLFRIEVRSPKTADAPKSTRYLDAASEAKRRRQWAEAEERRRWRAQLLLIKAKLEMIATGETTVEREFLADMVLPNGKTVAHAAIPVLAEMYRTGVSTPLLEAKAYSHHADDAEAKS